ncbi:hypothetical protein WMF27_20510 [Sorangium sp. So ce281]|uniref:hypothetical protein n=1 Tax=unclassified Sorangium TaxID=2621164 RepID=UPI003F61CD3C
MMPPPESEISAAELWLQITSVPRPYRLVPFPRKAPDGKAIGEIAMVVLTQEESMAATASTERFVRKMLKEQGALPQNGEVSAGYSTLFENRCSCEVLFRACKRKEDISRPFFPSIEAVAQKLTTDEIGVLMFNYTRVQSELGPIVGKMSQEEMDAWIERLAVGGSSFPLDSLSLAARSQLMLYMASQLYSSRMASSSPGTQPETVT